MLEFVREPGVEPRPGVLVREIPVPTPMKGLLQVNDRLRKELSRPLWSLGKEGEAFGTGCEPCLADRRLDPPQKTWTMEPSIVLDR